MRAIGDMAHANLAAIRLADAYQALAVANISELYEAEDDEFGADNLRWDLMVQELESARADGKMDEFNRKALEILAPALQQILTEQPDGSTQ